MHSAHREDVKVSVRRMGAMGELETRDDGGRSSGGLSWVVVLEYV